MKFILIARQMLLICLLLISTVVQAGFYAPADSSRGEGATEFNWQQSWGSIHMNTLADGLIDPGTASSFTGEVPCAVGEVCQQLNYPNKDQILKHGGYKNGFLDNGIKFDIKNSFLGCMSTVVTNWPYTHGPSYSNSNVCLDHVGSGAPSTVPYGGTFTGGKTDGFYKIKNWGLKYRTRTYDNSDGQHSLVYLPIYDPRSNDPNTENNPHTGPGCKQQIINGCGNIKDIHACTRSTQPEYARDPEIGYEHQVSHVFSDQEKSDLGLKKGDHLPATYYEYDKYEMSADDIKDNRILHKESLPTDPTTYFDVHKYKDVKVTGTYDCSTWGDPIVDDVPALKQMSKTSCVDNLAQHKHLSCTSTVVSPETDCECHQQIETKTVKTCDSTEMVDFYDYTFIPDNKKRKALSITNNVSLLKSHVPNTTPRKITTEDPNLAHIKTFKYDIVEGDMKSFIIVDPSDFYDLRLYQPGGARASQYLEKDSKGLVKTYEDCPVLGLHNGYGGICDPNGKAGCNLPVYGVGTATTFTDNSKPAQKFEYNPYPIKWSGYVKNFAIISIKQYFENIKGRESLYFGWKDLNPNPILMVTRAAEYCDPREMVSKFTRPGAKPFPTKDLPCIHYLQYQARTGYGDYGFVNLFGPNDDPYDGKIVVDYKVLHLYDVQDDKPIVGKPVAGTGDNHYISDKVDLLDKTHLSFFDKAVTYTKNTKGVITHPLAVDIYPVTKNSVGDLSPGVSFGKGSGFNTIPGTASSIRMPDKFSFTDKKGIVTQSSCAIVIHSPKDSPKVFIPTNSKVEFQSFVDAANGGLADVPIKAIPCSAGFVPADVAHVTDLPSPSILTQSVKKAAPYFSHVDTTTWFGKLSCEDLKVRPTCNQTQMITGTRFCKLESGTLDDCGACSDSFDPDSSLKFTDELVGGKVIADPGSSSAARCYFAASCFNALSAECPAANTTGGHVFCLAPETKITMADGTKKEISKIKAGEEVMAFEGKESRNTILKKAKITATAITKKQDIIKINDLKITPLHKIVLANGRAVMANEVKIGDSIMTAEGMVQEVKSIETNLKPIDVYNLVLENGSDGYIANGVRVLSYPLLKGLKNAKR